MGWGTAPIANAEYLLPCAVGIQRNTEKHVAVTLAFRMS